MLCSPPRGGSSSPHVTHTTRATLPPPDSAFPTHSIRRWTHRRITPFASAGGSTDPQPVGGSSHDVCTLTGQRSLAVDARPPSPRTTPSTTSFKCVTLGLCASAKLSARTSAPMGGRGRRAARAVHPSQVEGCTHALEFPALFGLEPFQNFKKRIGLFIGRKGSAGRSWREWTTRTRLFVVRRSGLGEGGQRAN